MDYFDIKIDGEIRRLGAANIVRGCYTSDNFPNDSLCKLFTRNASNLINTVTNNYINIAEQTNRGIDLTVSYGHQLPWDVKMNVDLQSTWQLKDTIALFADTVEDNNGFVEDPDWTGRLNFRFTKNDWTAFWGVNMIGKASDAETEDTQNAAGTTFYKVHTEFTAYHNISLQKKFEGFTLLGGVSNVFNEAPPAVTLGQGEYSTVGGSVFASQYDYLGRRVFLNISTHF